MFKQKFLPVVFMAAFLVLSGMGCGKGDDSPAQDKPGKEDTAKKTKADKSADKVKSAAKDHSSTKGKASAESDAKTSMETDADKGGETTTAGPDPVRPSTAVETGKTFEAQIRKEIGQYYKVTPGGQGYLQVNCTDVPEKVTLAYRFVDRTGEELQDTHESNAFAVQQGNYYIAVYEKWKEEVSTEVQCKIDYIKEMDPHEPNNTAKNAKEAALDKEISFAVYPRWDKDYFKVEVPEDGYLNAVVTEPAKDLTYNFRFMKTAGDDMFKKSEFEEIQDSHESNAVRVSKGTYIVGVSDKWNNMPKSFQKGKMKFVFVPEMDPYEPNDTAENAKEVALDKEISFAVYPRWDKDYFKVKVPEDGYLNAVVTEPAKDLTYNFRFMKTAGDYMFKKSEFEEIQDSHESNAVRVSKGTYIVGVSDKWNNMPKSFQKGKMKFVFVPEMDPHEPNDTAKNAKEVALDEEISFAVYPRWDKDHFKVKVPEAGYLNAVVTEPVNDLTYNFRFFITGGEDMFKKDELEEIQDSQESNAIRVTKGTYIIGVRDRWDNMPGSFQKGKMKFVFVPEMDPYEPNNTAEEAKAISLGEEFDFAIYPRWDKDFFEVEVEEKGELKVVMTGPAEDLTYNYYFGDASGSELQSTHEKNSLQVEAGTYIIGLWDRWENRPQSLQKGKAKIVLVEK